MPDNKDIFALDKDSEELDLKKLNIFFKRNKNYFIYSSFFFAFLAFIYTTFKKPIYEGEFQILLSNQSAPLNPLIARNLNQIETSLGGGIGGLQNSKKTNLKSEVEILKNPSVMQPVFEFVKDYSSNINGENIDAMRYKSWFKSSLDIRLIKGLIY